MSLVFTSVIAHSLQETLNTIIDDDTDGVESSLLLAKYCKQQSMDGAYEDDLEMGGPGLAYEKPEGSEMGTGSIKEGPVTRYIARTFALKMLVTEEALEDKKYDKAINAARRLKRAMYKTADIDACNMLVRMFNPIYTGGDGQPLASASHTLPGGGTWSNIMATPMSPSRQAVIIATSAMRKFPGHDGITEGVEPKKIVCPTEQWAVWAGITRSTKAPEPGANNEINVVNSDLDLQVIPIKYWTNTTTNYAFITDAENGLSFRWRRKPRSRTWVDNDQELMKYGISSRWARGWSEPRAVYGVQA
jgi:hypothetical protein